MRLYAGSTTDFVLDATQNRVARRLESAFLAHYRYNPSHGEVRSWEESLARLGLVISAARLEDHGIFLEYQLPLTSRRLDALITGEDSQGAQNAVIVELKQWEKALSKPTQRPSPHRVNLPTCARIGPSATSLSFT